MKLHHFVLLLTVALLACNSPLASKYQQPQVRASTATARGPNIPPSWTVPAWFVDPANVSTSASDNNNCTTSSTPCVTFAEIVGRWGTISPILSQDTTVTFLSSQASGVDLIEWSPFLIGSSAIIQGTTPTVVTSGVVLAGKVAKSRTAGSNSLLQFNLGATAAIGQMIENTSHPSRAWVYSLVSGTTFNVTQPLVKTTVPSFGATAEVDTWANNDTVNLLTPVTINLAYFNPIRLVYSAAFSNGGFVYQAILSNLVRGSPISLGSINVFETKSAEITLTAGQGTSFAQLTNVFLSGGILLYGSSASGFAMFGGAIPSSAGNCNISGSVEMDGDVIVNCSNAFAVVPNLGGLPCLYLSGPNASFGYVYLDSNFYISSGEVFAQAGNYAGAPIFYGNTGKNINLIGNAHMSVVGNNFTASFTAPALVSPGIIINGNSSACSHTNAAPDVVNCAISTTPAHLDAAAGAAGFGSNAYFPGGASVGNFN